MRILLFAFLLLFATMGMRAQGISHIETSKSWYFIYDQNGKRIKTLSTTQGKLMGYSTSFYIIKQGSSFYVTFDASGKRLHTFGTHVVGDIIAVAGYTFTSRKGSWIYTWSKEGKKLSTRSAR